MAEAGSFADRVKQQADIVRVVGDYVRLKKTGKDFSGLCPFHQEKTPSFTVSPIKQIFYCFGCGKGGDIFNFVMDIEKCEFLEAVRTIAEKCGISIPRPKERSPEERKENQQRAALVEMHRETQAFFTKQILGTLEGKAARAYLEDRGIDNKTIDRFGIGYAPSDGDALLRLLKQKKYDEKSIVESGLISRGEQGGRLFDRFRRRITFPIANESGKIVAFGCRALGDDQPKYLNSPETPIYSKSNVLYNLDQAKQSLKELRYEGRYIVLVEGYVDCIQVHSIGVPAVASCGTSLTEAHAKLLKRFSPAIVVWYDSDSAGRAGTERSLDILLAQELDVSVYKYDQSRSKDPDTYIREVGVDQSRAPLRRFEHLLKTLQARDQENQLRKQLTKDLEKEPHFADRLEKEAEVRRKIEEIKSQIPSAQGAELTSYADFLLEQARKVLGSTPEAKLAALNALMPHLQYIANPILRSEWATRIAQQLRLDEPVLRAALIKATKERRSEVKIQPELVGRSAKPVERRLIRMLAESAGFRRELAQQMHRGTLHHGLETEKIFEALMAASLSDEPVQATKIAAQLEERDRRTLFEILFEDASEPTWDEAMSCIQALQQRKAERELADVQRSIEANPAGPELRGLLEKKQELMRRIASAR